MRRERVRGTSGSESSRPARRDDPSGEVDRSWRSLSAVLMMTGGCCTRARRARAPHRGPGKARSTVQARAVRARRAQAPGERAVARVGGRREATGRLLQRDAQAQPGLRLRQLGGTEPGDPGAGPRRHGEGYVRREGRREPPRRGHQCLRKLDLRVGRAIAGRAWRPRRPASPRCPRPGTRRRHRGRNSSSTASPLSSTFRRRDPGPQDEANDLGGARSRAAGDHHSARAPQARLHLRQRPGGRRVPSDR